MRSHRLRREVQVWLLVPLVALACYPVRAGFWPPIERLPELRPGISSKAEVEALLGTPLGRGAAHFTREMPRREIWVYGFMDFDGKSTSIEYGELMVFFDGGHYDGHLWRSGRPPEPSGAVSPP